MMQTSLEETVSIHTSIILLNFNTFIAQHPNQTDLPHFCNFLPSFLIAFEQFQSLCFLSSRWLLFPPGKDVMSLIATR